MNLFRIEHSVFLLIFLVIFDKFHCFFFCLKPIWRVCRKLVLSFVGDENDLHCVCVMIDYDKIIILKVGNNLVCFLKNLL